MRFSKSLQKLIVSGATVLTLVSLAVPAMAATVKYKGIAVEWDYGRTVGLWGYSKVQTNHFTHSATVNGVSSGWKKNGKLASATKFLGTGSVEAYWGCK